MLSALALHVIHRMNEYLPLPNRKGGELNAEHCFHEVNRVLPDIFAGHRIGRRIARGDFLVPLQSGGLQYSRPDEHIVSSCLS